MSIKLFERTEIDITKYGSDTIRGFFPTEQDARREYSRLRSVAQKRLERLERVSKNEDDIIAGDARRVIDKTGEFAKLSTIEGQDVYTQLERVARFLNSTESSVSTLRETKTKTIESLKDNETVQKMIKKMRESQQLDEKKKDQDWAPDFTPIYYADDDEDEDEEDFIASQEISDFEVQGLIRYFEILSRIGLSEWKYNEELLEYFSWHTDADEEEIMKMMDIISRTI